MSIPSVGFPASIDDDTSLFVAVNNVYTTLSADMDDTQNYANVVDTSDFPSSGFISIDDEICYYESKTPTQFQSLTREVDGTTKAAHLASIRVGARVIAIHHNRLKDAIVAVMTALGVNLANVAKIASGALEFRTDDLLTSRNASPPVGWSDVTATYASRYVRVGTGTVGGAATHTHTGPSHSHTVSLQNYGFDYSSPSINGYIAAAQYVTTWHGAGKITSPPVTTAGGTGNTGSASNNPLYVDVRMYKKN